MYCKVVLIDLIFILICMLYLMLQHSKRLCFNRLVTRHDEMIVAVEAEAPDASVPQMLWS